MESIFQCRQRVLADTDNRDAEEKGANHNRRHRQAKTGCDKGHHQKQSLHEDLLFACFLGVLIVVCPRDGGNSLKAIIVNSSCSVADSVGCGLLDEDHPHVVIAVIPLIDTPAVLPVAPEEIIDLEL